MASTHSGENVRYLPERKAPYVVDDHSDLNSQNTQSEKRSHLLQSLKRKLFVVIGSSQHLRKQIKYRLNGCSAAFQPLGDGWLSDKAVVGVGIAAILPFRSRGQQDDTLGCPGSDAQGFEVGIIADYGIWMKGEQGCFFLLQNLAFRYTGRLAPN